MRNIHLNLLLKSMKLLTSALERAGLEKWAIILSSLLWETTTSKTWSWSRMESLLRKILQRSKWNLTENSKRRFWSWERRNKLKMKQMEMMESLMSSMLSLSSETCVEWRLSGMPTRLEHSSTGVRWAASALAAVKRNRGDSRENISSRNGQRLKKLVSLTTSNGRILDTVLNTEEQCQFLFGLLQFS